MSGNNWPTISYLQENLWEDSFDGSLLLPANLLSLGGLTQYGAITTEIALKEGAGFPTTIIDPWGRLLSYQLLKGPFGGVSKYMSSLPTYQNFTDFNAPFPIITAIGVVADEDQCTPPANGTQYEFHPYEFGSWDDGVSAFTPIKYLGSELDNGKPVKEGKCVVKYDNLGYVLGTSSNIFSAICEVLAPANSSADPLANVLEGIISLVHNPVFEDLFGLYRNPWYNYKRSSRVSDDKELLLVDGSFSNQNSPIWPFIVNERPADVLIVNDNSADTEDNFPDIRASASRRPEQNALYPGQEHFHQRGPEHPRHILRLRRAGQSVHCLPAQQRVQLRLWRADIQNRLLEDRDEGHDRERCAGRYAERRSRLGTLHGLRDQEPRRAIA
jgi:lysophospholipase